MTPPAVSVKIPVVSASSRIPSRISSSVTESIEPPGAPRQIERVGPVGRDRRSRGSWRSCRASAACRRRCPRRTRSRPASSPRPGRRRRSAARPRPGRARASREMPRPSLVNSEPEAIGHDDPVGELPAELLDRLEGERLRALGVVGAEVDVDERPRAGLGELGAEAVDVVVVAVDADQVGAVDAGGEQLLLLEVGGDEDVGVEARRRRRGRRRRWRGCRWRRRRRSRSRAPSPWRPPPRRRGP